MFKTLSIFVHSMNTNCFNRMRFKNLMTVCTMVVLLTLTSSCSTKMKAIDRLEDLSAELRENSRYYSLGDWERAGKEFIEIRKDIAKHELDYTPEQKKRIGVLEGKCAGYMAKGAKEGVFDKIKGFANEINGVLQGILNAVTDFVE